MRPAWRKPPDFARFTCPAAVLRQILSGCPISASQPWTMYSLTSVALRMRAHYRSWLTQTLAGVAHSTSRAPYVLSSRRALQVCTLKTRSRPNVAITEFGHTPLYSRDELASVGVDIVLYCCSAYRAMNAAAARYLANVDSHSTTVAIRNFERSNSRFSSSTTSSGMMLVAR